MTADCLLTDSPTDCFTVTIQTLSPSVGAVRCTAHSPARPQSPKPTRTRGSSCLARCHAHVCHRHVRTLVYTTGALSIVGRSIVIHKEAGGARWVCANIEAKGGGAAAAGSVQPPSPHAHTKKRRKPKTETHTALCPCTHVQAMRSAHPLDRAVSS